MIQVYHALNTRDSFFMGPGDVVTDQVRLFRDNNEYQLVANVETNDLDEAYQLTNTIHCYWGENPGVTEMKPHNRSTSVGDILVHGNKAYLVVGIGFEEIPR